MDGGNLAHLAHASAPLYTRPVRHAECFMSATLCEHVAGRAVTGPVCTPARPHVTYTARTPQHNRPVVQPRGVIGVGLCITVLCPPLQPRPISARQVSPLLGANRKRTDVNPSAEWCGNNARVTVHVLNTCDILLVVPIMDVQIVIIPICAFVTNKMLPIGHGLGRIISRVFR